MKRLSLTLVLFALMAGSGGAMPVSAATAGGLAYPPAPRGDVVDDYFGTKVADPYRWMEDVDSPQTQAWASAEKDLSRRYLDAIPQRAKIRTRLQELYNYERLSVPFRAGKHYLYYRNSGLQNQQVLYVADSPTGHGRVLLDPNTLSPDGTVALGGTGFTLDGKYMAYSTRSAGSDWETWHVRDVDTGHDLPDVLQWSKFGSASWLPDDRGFYYERYDAPQKDVLKAAFKNHKAYFHRLGTPQTDDRLVYQRPDHPDWLVSADVTEDGRYLVLGTYDGSPRNRLFVRDLQDKSGMVRRLFTKNDAAWNFVANDGARFYIQTNKDAPRSKIVAIDVRRPSRMTTIVPESSDALQSASYLARRFVITYSHDVHSVVRVFDRGGHAIRDVGLPGLGTVVGFSGYQNDTKTYYAFSGYTTPTTGYEYDVITGRSRLIRSPRLNFDPSQFTTEEVFYNSQDGTRVPLFISYKKGLARDGSAPTILYAYGGFDISINPFFSIGAIEWMEMGGVYAVANIRGGGEYGERWHEAGMLANKQNVFDDFVAAAHYLIDNKWTSTPKLAINGASNGGLLIGAAETQHPDLFGACIAEVGVMDMLRFQKFTIGYSWVGDYGSSDTSAAQFKTLYAYSPYQNVREATAYPPTLIMTADHDDRVFPAHSFKFAAAMQRAQSGSAPVLLRVEHNAGHGGGTPVSKYIEETADKYAFLVKALGVNF
ncbi:MAG: prolyl oligopeptidase family serine peptidase [Candidatus Eremiobacteraeota bacterium]|nr:prolyl oligopeptidase family serine peptidase [Candidatus Eremiobacteraeota bacterium]